MVRKVEISHKTIIFSVAFILFLMFIYVIRDIILALFVSLLIMAVLNPWVTRLSKHNIPRALSVILVYLILLAMVSVSAAAIIPSLITQTTNFINNLPRTMGSLGISSVVSDQIIQQLITQLGSLPARVAQVVISLFSNVLGVVTVLVFAFYLLVDRETLDEQLTSMFEQKQSKQISGFIDELEVRLGKWARAQLGLMLTVGTANYIGLVLLGIPFALPLGILAGLFEIIPYIGPVLAAVPSVAIGFGISPFIGFAAAALAFLVQQLENYVLVPKFMEKSAGVNPIVTLLSLAIGLRLAGVVGMIISVPVFIAAQTVVKHYYSSGRLNNN
jgi:predicted PurR-regulated permease PerM